MSKRSSVNQISQTDHLLFLLNQRSKDLQEQFRVSHESCMKLINFNSQLKDKIRSQNSKIIELQNSKGGSNISTLPNQVLEEIQALEDFVELTNETTNVNCAMIEYMQAQDLKIRALEEALQTERERNHQLQQQNDELRTTAFELINLTQSHLIENTSNFPDA